MAEPNGTFVGIGLVRRHYWNFVDGLVSDAAEWANATKLNNNLRDPESRNSVWHVFLQYYRGDFGRLSATIARRRKQCLDDLLHIDRLAEELGIETAPEAGEVLGDLMSYERRKDWQALIEKHRKANNVVSIRELIREADQRERKRIEKQQKKQARLREKAEESRRRREELLKQADEAERKKAAEEAAQRGLVELPPELEEAIRRTREALARNRESEEDSGNIPEEGHEL